MERRARPAPSLVFPPDPRNRPLLFSRSKKSPPFFSSPPIPKKKERAERCKQTARARVVVGGRSSRPFGVPHHWLCFVWCLSFDDRLAGKKKKNVVRAVCGLSPRGETRKGWSVKPTRCCLTLRSVLRIGCVVWTRARRCAAEPRPPPPPTHTHRASRAPVGARRVAPPRTQQWTSTASSPPCPPPPWPPSTTRPTPASRCCVACPQPPARTRPDWR